MHAFNTIYFLLSIALAVSPNFDVLYFQFSQCIILIPLKTSSLPVNYLEVCCLVSNMWRSFFYLSVIDF